MASNLDYIDPALHSLEAKVKAYLEAEETHCKATADPAAVGLHATSAANIAQLKEEVLALLPTRDEWVIVNLGYGPSRVGAWHVPATASQSERWEVRVIQ